MKELLNQLTEKSKKGIKSLAVLIDPDKVQDEQNLLRLIRLAIENKVDYFFVGGSLITNQNLHPIVKEIKLNSNIPLVLFPGSNMHIDMQADAILFLSLISGRNPDLLIGQHVVAAPLLKRSKIEVWPTGYMLIESGTTTTVMYMSNTAPIPNDKYAVAACTAMAGEMLGLQLMYMDAGSGAKIPVPARMIQKVRSSVNCPLIVGGGISDIKSAKEAFDAGADLLVVGNAIEQRLSFMTEVAELIADKNRTASWVKEE